MLHQTHITSILSFGEQMSIFICVYFHCPIKKLVKWPAMLSKGVGEFEQLQDLLAHGN